MKYYRLDKILSKNCTYNLIIGERSNGKTYAVLEYCIRQYFKTGSQFAIIRRWGVDIQGRRASGMFSAINENGLIRELSDGQFDCVHYWAGKFYLGYHEDGKVIYNDNDIIAFPFAISEQEHNKSISFPNVNNILFDEFITNAIYLQDEFIAFMNTLSTIIRQRDSVKIFMCGNTVNKYCPYFEEMGLKHVSKMNQGSIDVYTYSDSKLKVAVEYCATSSKTKKSNFYFAFDNPKLNMITRGSWELDIFPHLPKKYNPKNILIKFFILFDGLIYQGELIDIDSNPFVYIHDKTTPIQDENKDIVITLESDYRKNYFRNIFSIPILGNKLEYLYKANKWTYQNNDVGNSIQNYIKCM